MVHSTDESYWFKFLLDLFFPRCVKQFICICFSLHSKKISTSVITVDVCVRAMSSQKDYSDIKFFTRFHCRIILTI